MIGITNVVNKRKSEAERMNLTLKTNQSEHTDLLGVNFTLTYGTYTKSYTWSGSTITIEVPNGVEYTLTFPDVEGYACNTKSVTYTAQSGNSRMLEVLYQCELLTVNVCADSGVPTGFEVKIQKVETVGVATKYARLEYIESNGSQFIDTNFVPSINTTVVADLLIPSGAGNKNLFCAYTNYALNSMSDSKLEYRLGSGNWTQINTPSNVTNKFNVEFSCKTIKFNGEIIATPNLTSLSNTYTLLLFTRSGGSSSYYGKARIYTLKIYENGNIVRDYIPALRSDGIAGLYDAVNDAFYSSYSPDNFIAGFKNEEIIATQTSVTGTYKIPYGVGYVLNWNQLENFETSGVYFKISDRPSNVVNIEYTRTDDAGITNPSSGVWIQGINGKFYTTDEWDGTQTPNGVAVITDSCRFVIALEDSYDSYCSWGGYGVLLNDIVQATNITTALLNYQGEQDTTAIINALKGTNDGYSDGAPAAEYCRAYIFPNGSIGYLGAAGEWQAALDNKTAINSALKLCGGVEMSEVYWTCTQYNKDKSWYIRWHNEFFDISNRYLGCGVRAFASN